MDLCCGLGPSAYLPKGWGRMLRPWVERSRGQLHAPARPLTLALGVKCIKLLFADQQHLNCSWGKFYGDAENGCAM